MGPVRDDAPRIAVLLLAAGLGQRMGAGVAKLLRPLAGKPLWRHAAETLAAGDWAARWAVLGPATEVAASALHDLGFQCVFNNAPEAGLSGSLRLGLSALPGEIDAVLIALGDMPQVQPRTLQRLAAAFAPAAGRAICVPVQQGRRGNPVLWDAALIPALQAVSGDRGGCDLLLRHADLICEVAVDDPGVLLDIDTAEALAALATALLP